MSIGMARWSSVIRACPAPIMARPSISLPVPSAATSTAPTAVTFISAAAPCTTMVRRDCLTSRESSRDPRAGWHSLPASFPGDTPQARKAYQDLFASRGRQLQRRFGCPRRRKRQWHFARPGHGSRRKCKNHLPPGSVPPSARKPHRLLPGRTKFCNALLFESVYNIGCVRQKAALRLFYRALWGSKPIWVVNANGVC
jgi:hypothetical protein